VWAKRFRQEKARSASVGKKNRFCRRNWRNWRSRLDTEVR